MGGKLAILGLALGASALELTPDNWDSETAGKTVFIKFLAPWWGHCKKMKPDWDKLMKEFKDSKTALVADVDCTAAGKPLCDSNGVQGFPTIKWGDPASLEKYEGGRSFDALKKFADENLKPMCSPTNIDLCDDDKKAEIAKLQEMSDEDLEKEIEAKEKEMADAEETFKTEVQKLQEKYQQLQKDKEDALAAVKESGLGLMKAVKASKGSSDEAKTEL